MRTLKRTSLFLLLALASVGARAAQAAPRGPLGVGMKVSSATASPGGDVVVPLGAHVAVAVFGTVFPDSDGWATTPTIELRPFPGRRATAFAFAGPRFERHAWRGLDADLYGVVAGVGHEWRIARAVMLVGAVGVDLLEPLELEDGGERFTRGGFHPMGEVGLRLLVP